MVRQREGEEVNNVEYQLRTALSKTKGHIPVSGINLEEIEGEMLSVAASA